MSLHKVVLTSIVINLFVTITHTFKLHQDRREKVHPIIYKVLERNDDVFLEKEPDAAFDKKNFMLFLQNKADLEYNVNNILNKDEGELAGTKKRWAKRILAHEDRSPAQKFYSDNGISFKPLVRVHKTKKVDNTDDLHSKQKSLNNGIIPEINVIENELSFLGSQISMKNFEDKLEKTLRYYKNLERIRKEIGKMKFYTPDAGHVIQHMTEIDYLVGQTENVDEAAEFQEILKRRLATVRADVEKLHQEILEVVELGRYKHLRVKAHEAPSIDDRDADEIPTSTIKVLDGLAIPYLDEPEPVSELPRPMFPHQPLWNSWNKRQSIIKDECPPGQAKVGAICVRIPHH